MIDTSSLTHSAQNGRIACPKYIASQHKAADFAGLASGQDRYRLLLLVKRAGKLAGFTPRMIQLLDYYMAYTRDTDWEEGSRPIVFQSLAKTSLDLGISERQIQKLERQLCAVGAITWQDSGNHKRYGRRCAKTGQIIYAFGVDLSPLAALEGALEDKLSQKKTYDAAWMETKRQISYYRAQINAHLNALAAQGRGEDLSHAYGDISVQIRTHMDLERLKSLLGAHKDLLEMIKKQHDAGNPPSNTQHSQPQKTPLKTQKESCRNVQNDAHKESTIQKQLDKSINKKEIIFTGAVKEKPIPIEEVILSTGLQHITLKNLTRHLSNRLMNEIPPNMSLSWQSLVETAYRFLPVLGISQKSWGRACETLTRNGAAVLLVLTEKASQRAHNPIHEPAAYFNGLIQKANKGELNLIKSISSAG